MSAPNPAEAEDRNLQLIGWGILALALKFVADAAVHLVDERWATTLDRAAIGLALGSVLLILPVLAWKFRHAGARRAATGDGFVASMLRESQAGAMNAALLALVALEVASKRLVELPSEFFLQLVLAVLLGTFAIKFLVLSRASTEG